MSSLDGRSRGRSGAFAAQVAAAECLAKAIVDAFEMCEQSGASLSQVQKVAVIEASLLEFDGFEAHLGSIASIGELLEDLGRT